MLMSEKILVFMSERVLVDKRQVKKQFSAVSN